MYSSTFLDAVGSGMPSYGKDGFSRRGLLNAACVCSETKICSSLRRGTQSRVFCWLSQLWRNKPDARRTRQLLIYLWVRYFCLGPGTKGSFCSGPRWALQPVAPAGHLPARFCPLPFLPAGTVVCIPR